MKQYKPHILSLAFFLTLAFFSPETLARVSTKEAATFLPPTPVKCKNDALCDRNPKHLETFVAEFYRWNEANDILFFASVDAEIKSPLSPEEHQRRIEESAKIEMRVMHESLTHEFNHWNAIYTTDPPPDPNPRYCHGGNALTCAQDEDEEWIKATAHLIEIAGHQARILVELPFSSSDDRPPAALQLSVQLKVERGAWRIDSVCCDTTISVHTNDKQEIKWPELGLQRDSDK